MDSKQPSIPNFTGRRGANAIRGCWLSLEEAKARALGNEEWWKLDLHGKTVSVHQYDKHGPKDKPFWLFENGDMYLGRWKDHGNQHQYPVEEGFGVTYIFNPEGRVYVGMFKNGLCHGHGKSVWLQSSFIWRKNNLTASHIREESRGKRVVGRPYIYIGSYRNDLEYDRNATVTLKDGTSRVGPWQDGKPVLPLGKDWWTAHPMVTHRSERIKKKKKQGEKKKRALVDDTDSEVVLVTKTLTTAKIPRNEEIIEVFDSSDDEKNKGNVIDIMSSEFSLGGVSSWAGDSPPPSVEINTNSPVSHISNAISTATSQAKTPPTSIAASRVSNAPVSKMQHDLFPPFTFSETGMYHHRFRFVRTECQMEIQANSAMKNGKQLLEAAIAIDKEEKMGVFTFTPKDAAQIKNKQLMLDFRFAIGHRNETITLSLKEFKQSKIEFLAQGIQSPYVTEYRLVLRQPAFIKDAVILDLSD